MVFEINFCSTSYHGEDNQRDHVSPSSTVKEAQLPIAKGAPSDEVSKRQNLFRLRRFAFLELI